MNLKFYTTHCPMCSILQKKLDNAGLQYEICEDTQKMLDLGFTSMPMLEIDNCNTLSFKQACDWINDYVKENG